MASLSVAFACGLVLLFRQNMDVSRPKIRVAHAPLVLSGNALPKHAAGGFASIADGVGDDLARAPALGRLDPTLVLAPRDEGPPSR